MKKQKRWSVIVAGLAVMIGGVSVSAKAAGGTLGKADRAVLDRLRADYTKGLVDAAVGQSLRSVGGALLKHE